METYHIQFPQKTKDKYELRKIPLTVQLLKGKKKHSLNQLLYLFLETLPSRPNTCLKLWRLRRSTKSFIQNFEIPFIFSLPDLDKGKIPHPGRDSSVKFATPPSTKSSQMPEVGLWLGGSIRWALLSSSN